MKAKGKMSSVFVILMLLSGLNGINAQPYGNSSNCGQCWQNQGCINFLPDLTDEQKNKIDDLRISHKQEMLKFRTSLQEKSAKLNSLQIEENPDMKAINSVIDEIGKIKTEMTKSQVSHRQDVRSLLTKEQKVIFDQHAVNRGNGQGMSKGNGNRNGKGRGNGRGMGPNGPNCPYRN